MVKGKFIYSYRPVQRSQPELVSIEIKETNHQNSKSTSNAICYSRSSLTIESSKITNDRLKPFQKPKIVIKSQKTTEKMRINRICSVTAF